MHKEKLKEAVKLGQKLGQVYLATADSKGVPHISVVQNIDLDSRGYLDVVGWFCQHTYANLEVNHNVSVLIWDERKDYGFQCIGTMEKEEELNILDGIAPSEESHPVPQIEREIHIHVDKILKFEKAPHIDVEA